MTNRQTGIMTSLLEIREYLRAYYGRYEMYINPILHFLVAFITLSVINSKLGFFSRIDGFMPVLVVSLICSILPYGAISFFSSLFILLHLYALSLEVAGVVLGIFLIMYLLYFRFNTGDSIALVMTPLLFFMKIPYVMPLAVGLLSNPAGAVATGCGTVLFYTLKFIGANSTVLMGNEQTATGERFKFCLDGIIQDKEMMLMMAVFAITILAVYIIRRLSLDYSWMIAIIAGAIGQVVIILMGDLILDVGISLVGTILGSIAAVGIAAVIQFFQFMLDYTRTERVQFEDDDYYYYVKAVPKINLGTTERTTKKINQRRHSYGEGEDTGASRIRAGRERSAAASDEKYRGLPEEYPNPVDGKTEFPGDDVKPYALRSSSAHGTAQDRRASNAQAPGRTVAADSSNNHAKDIARQREELLKAREQAVRKQAPAAQTGAAARNKSQPVQASGSQKYTSRTVDYNINPTKSGAASGQSRSAAGVNSLGTARNYSQSVRGTSDGDRDAARREAVQRLRQLQAKSGSDGDN